MTIEIRAKVQRHPKVGGTPQGEPWLALVYTLDPEPAPDHVDTYETTWCGSLPEAIQAVQVMRARLERQLMDEVHASRASRRALRCGACRDLSNVHQYTPDCEYRDERCAACLGRDGEHTYLDNCDERVRNWSEFVREYAAAAAASYAAEDVHTKEPTA